MNGAEIKAIRKALGMTAKVFAKAIGLTGYNAHITISRWENCKANPSGAARKMIETLAQKHQAHD